MPWLAGFALFPAWHGSTDRWNICCPTARKKEEPAPEPEPEPEPERESVNPQAQKVDDLAERIGLLEGKMDLKMGQVGSICSAHFPYVFGLIFGGCTHRLRTSWTRCSRRCSGDHRPTVGV